MNENENKPKPKTNIWDFLINFFGKLLKFSTLIGLAIIIIVVGAVNNLHRIEENELPKFFNDFIRTIADSINELPFLLIYSLCITIILITVSICCGLTIYYQRKEIKRLADERSKLLHVKELGSEVILKVHHSTTADNTD